ncbi:hypothetical protein H6F86_14515 [Phormidium sp. FACHB-592]|uniref:Uncharacterized protein n=1 Tax=Stenomitos frigidus AS-A4 TaxID=2933935 RepID=A0ABV0KLM1_9CYAN|nr:hypothetical protein [Phormidium sp. FACHB-592]MBD2075088.1 hypothetical protein [Phormidium sp. FACHB-592]
MVGSVERIEQELAALDKATGAIADEFYNAYSSYLTVLGQAVRQQLILASYHVCTQGYPESFLKLSYSQRQQLQQRLRTLSQQVQEEVLAQLHVPVVIDDPDVEPVASLPVVDELTALDSLPSTPPPAPVVAPVSSPTEPRSLTPVDLARWHEELEHAIVAELKTASHAANRLLQQANILPPKLPEPVLEAAAKADLSDARAGTPNLLNLLVETSGKTAENDDDESPKHSVMHIVAISLRLAEIEFAAPAVTAARSKIRSLFAQLKTLGREYRKKQRERSIAEAQAAWRSTWTED